MKIKREPTRLSTARQHRRRANDSPIRLRREYFRDIYDHLLRLNQTIETIRDSASTAISMNLSMIRLQQSETTKRLVAYAALIAVPTMVAGIYGMNFEHMPELGWKFGYPAALGVMAVIDVYVFYKLRKAKWI